MSPLSDCRILTPPMSHTREYEVIIIGSGPGGYVAAMKCAKAGKRVCLIERDSEVGGSCPHRGTNPSQALRHAIPALVRAHTSP